MEAAFTSRYVVRGSGAVSGVSNPIHQIQIMNLPGQLRVVSDQNRWVRLRTKAVAELCVKTSLYRPTSGFWFSTVYCSRVCPLGQWDAWVGLVGAEATLVCSKLFHQSFVNRYTGRNDTLLRKRYFPTVFIFSLFSHSDLQRSEVWPL